MDKRGKEFGRFFLSMNTDNLSNGSIMASLRRYGDTWALKARGYYVHSTKTYKAILPILTQVMNNNFS